MSLLSLLLSRKCIISKHWPDKHQQTSPGDKVVICSWIPRLGVSVLISICGILERKSCPQQSKLMRSTKCSCSAAAALGRKAVHCGAVRHVSCVPPPLLPFHISHIWPFPDARLFRPWARDLYSHQHWTGMLRYVGPWGGWKLIFNKRKLFLRRNWTTTKNKIKEGTEITMGVGSVWASLCTCWRCAEVGIFWRLRSSVGSLINAELWLK